MLRVCSYCKRILGYTEPHHPRDSVTHGCCEYCSAEWNRLIDEGRFYETPKPKHRAGVPACMQRAGI